MPEVVEVLHALIDVLAGMGQIHPDRAAELHAALPQMETPLEQPEVPDPTVPDLPTS